MSFGPRIPLPPVFCLKCGKPLTVRYIRDLAKASAAGRPDSELQCPNCKGLGGFNSKILIAVSKLVEAINRSVYKPPSNSGRPKKIIKCPGCGKEDTARWYHTHTGNGHHCKTTGEGISPEAHAAAMAEAEKKQNAPRKFKAPFAVRIRSPKAPAN